ncbi:MAG: hypothetical protein EBZ15_06390 [Actinobacteria bacterium]|nr:hypothetical protein [Actinomycetota bacterium]
MDDTVEGEWRVVGIGDAGGVRADVHTDGADHDRYVGDDAVADRLPIDQEFDPCRPPRDALLVDTEHVRAQRVWRKRFGEVAPDPATRAKHWRFLIGRGFAPDVVQAVLRAAARDPTA